MDERDPDTDTNADTPRADAVRGDGPAAAPEGENEVLRQARLVKSLRPGGGWKTAAGIGVGSAAVIAALLYARRPRK